MDAQAILLELERLGCEVEVEGDRLTVSPASRLTKDLRFRIRECKLEIISVIRSPPPTPALRCPVCGEDIVTEIVRDRFVHSYCAEPRHYDAWATTDGARFGDLIR